MPCFPQFSLYISIIEMNYSTSEKITHPGESFNHLDHFYIYMYYHYHQYYDYSQNIGTLVCSSVCRK
jgi:hypothetical protein